MEAFKRIDLANGLQVEFFDRSNRYFGDYHRIQVEVRLRFELPVQVGPDAEFWQRVRMAHGHHLEVRRVLERMAVPTADTDRVRERLVTDFLAHNRPYLERPTCLKSLAATAMHQRRQRPAYAP